MVRKNYIVRRYSTGDVLNGTPSPNLVRESLTEHTTTGAVLARCCNGVWVPSSACDGSLTVYVEER